jgi:hypothetical protein
MGLCSSSTIYPDRDYSEFEHCDSEYSYEEEGYKNNEFSLNSCVETEIIEIFIKEDDQKNNALL